MTISVDQFLKHLSHSGVWTPAELTAFESKIPSELRNNDAEWLATELVQRKKLTQFQANTLNSDVPAPLVLGNYVLEEIIGSGGMGVVYKARHQRMKRVVAVKVLSQKSIQSRVLVQRFLREAEASAQLSHPNIVAAYDADEIDGIPFLAMEYVNGIDLAAHVARNGPMPFEQALDCVKQAALGLEHAHLLGIVHRDIKPANILLDQKGTIKILDMGLARFEEGSSLLSTAEFVLSADSTVDSDGVSQTGTLLGTVDFVSPEQALDSRAAGHWSDIYSLGATLFFLLTGKPMFEDNNLVDRLMAHRNSRRPSLCAINPSIPPQIDLLFHKMAARTKETRYQSMTDVIRHLTHWRKLKKATHPSTDTPHPPEPKQPSPPKSKPSSSPIDIIFDDDEDNSN